MKSNWRGASKEQIPYYNDNCKLVWYGHELTANTSYYLGRRELYFKE